VICHLVQAGGCCRRGYNGEQHEPSRFRQSLQQPGPRGFAQAERDVAEPPSPRRNWPLRPQDQQRLEVEPWQARPHFRCRICGSERWPQSASNLVVKPFKRSPSIELPMRAPTTTGHYVSYLRVLPMRTPPLAPRSTFKAFCDGNMI
jgi:hypothetical protein